MPGDATHASIWQKALVKKNEFLQEQKAKASIDRNEMIRSQLADFNRIQDMSRERDQLVQNIERMAESQPARA